MEAQRLRPAAFFLHLPVGHILMIGIPEGIGGFSGGCGNFRRGHAQILFPPGGSGRNRFIQGDVPGVHPEGQGGFVPVGKLESTQGEPAA